MTVDAKEFVYKLPGLSAGSRPGAHRSRSRGAGMEFAAHARLFDQPDPRRIDLRASLSTIPREWLVRANYQRSSVAIKAIVDVSASMHFGPTRTKLDVAADFLDALGFSAYRCGDSVSLMAFDHAFRNDLFMPARFGRGIGIAMAEVISDCAEGYTQAGSGDGLAECVDRIAGTAGLVFLVSDFHWSLDSLAPILDKLVNALVVPLVVWDKAEIEPPEQGRLLSVRDAESGLTSRLWLRKKTRQQWRDNVVRRRDEIAAAFAANDIRPFHLDNGFEAEHLSRYFLENVA